MGYRYKVWCDWEEDGIKCTKCFPGGPFVSRVFVTQKEAVTGAVDYTLGSIWDYEIEEIEDEKEENTQ